MTWIKAMTQIGANNAWYNPEANGVPSANETLPTTMDRRNFTDHGQAHAGRRIKERELLHQASARQGGAC